MEEGRKIFKTIIDDNYVSVATLCRETIEMIEILYVQGHVIGRVHYETKIMASAR